MNPDQMKRSLVLSAKSESFAAHENSQQRDNIGIQEPLKYLRDNQELK